MPSEVFRAIDAALVLGVEDKNAPEGAAADGLISQYGLSNTVGKLTGVTVHVKTDVKPFYEIGKRYPTHLRPGPIETTGTVNRAHINGALLRLLLGDGAVSPPSAGNFVQPSFNIIATLQNPARPEENAKLIIFGAKFSSWSYDIPCDDFVMEAVSFQALRVAFEEA